MTTLLSIEDSLIVARGLLAAACDTSAAVRAEQRGLRRAARALRARAARRRDDARWYAAQAGGRR